MSKNTSQCVGPERREIYRKARLLHAPDIDVEAMGITDLLEESTFLQDDILKIKDQINKAKRTAAATGIYADPDWFRRAEYALQVRGKLIQKVQLKISILKKENRGKGNWGVGLTEQDWEGFHKVVRWLRAKDGENEKEKGVIHDPS